MQVDVISTSEGLAELRDDWEDLERRDPHACYYVTHRYVSAWWSAHAAEGDRPEGTDLELHVARVCNNGKPVGIAPLVVATRRAGGQPRRVLRFAGDGDYRAPLLDPEASGGAVCKALLGHVESAAGWDRVNLGNIPAYSRWAHHLLKSSRNPSFLPHVECPYVDLTRFADLDTFARENVSSQLRNYRNKFYREHDPAFRAWHGDEDDIFARIADLHRREKQFLVERKARTERYSLFEDPAREAHIRALFTDTDDVVTFGYQTPAGELIGYITCFEHRRTMLSWNIAYHPDYEKHRVGRVLHYDTLAHLFETGDADRFDFGAGRYPWKFEWTGDFTPTYRLRLDLGSPAGDPPEGDSPGKTAAPQPLRQGTPARAPWRAAARRLVRSLRARLRPPVIWYIPHPDDETIFMGGSITRCRDRRSYLVVLTRGGASGARTLINARLDQPLSPEEFVQARRREFTAAIEALGVPAKHVTWHDLPDGGIDEDDVHRIIVAMARRHPRASHRTMSYLDPHRDHAAAGAALRSAHRDGAVSDCAFSLPVPLAGEDLGTAVPLGRPAVRAKRAALAEYQRWDPAAGRYAVGAHSVKKLIKTQSKQPRERVHGPTLDG